MRKFLLSTALVAICAPASAATVAIGGRFVPGTGDATGFVYGVKDYGPGILDGTGDVWGNIINFSHAPLFPTPVEVTFNTPNYGAVEAYFTSVASYAVTVAGRFFTLVGSFNHGAGSGFLSVNEVYPGHGISSFGLVGSFAYNPPAPPIVIPPPPPYVPPPVVPPVVVVNPPPVEPPPYVPPPYVPPYVPPVEPPVVAVPETSTWLMLLTGFGFLGATAWRKQRTARVLA